MKLFNNAYKHSLHPNKLVQKHENTIIDKYLKRKVKSAKSTLKNTNKFYSEKIRRIKNFVTYFIDLLERKKK